MKAFLFFFCFFLLVKASCQRQVMFYVSASGKDSNPGTIEKPFATLERARLAVREQLKTQQHDSVFVFIRKGSYFIKNSLRLDSLDSGQENTPVIYSAYRRETVSINGGLSIPVSKAVKVTDKKILERIVPEARNKVLQVNLRSAGITEIIARRSKGFGRPYTPAAMELFCNHETMQPARWPNDSLIPIGKVLDPGSIPRNGDYSHRGGTFLYDVDRPQRWAQANDIWISGFFKYGFADDAVKIARIDTVNKTFTTAEETAYGFESGKNFQRWFAFNLLEEIDRPGEYCIDKDAGILYFYPPTGSLQSIELSALETPLVALKNTSHIVFRNITFECSRGMGIYIEKGNGDRIENCTVRNIGMVGICIGKGTTPANELWSVANVKPASEMLGSLDGYLYENTVFDREAGTNHVVSGCHIYNIGSGGISLSGGNRTTLQHGNNQVENCQIHDFNRIDRSYKAGINIDGTGNIIRYNEIYNCPGSAIYLHGNDHLIEFNDIHDAVVDGNDMGAVYYGRNPSEFGNRIVNNFFHHIGNKDGSIMTIYHDDGACGMEVTGNVFYKAGSKTVMIGGGNDNTYRNNIFIDCPLAFHIDNRLQNWAVGFIQKDGLFQKRLNAVNYLQFPYASAYPHLKDYFQDNVGLPKRNFIENNVFVNVKQLQDGKPEWSCIGTNYVTCDESIFVNYKEMNFLLKTDAEVFKILKTFRQIPFYEIGPHK